MNSQQRSKPATDSTCTRQANIRIDLNRQDRLFVSQLDGPPICLDLILYKEKAPSHGSRHDKMILALGVMRLRKIFGGSSGMCRMMQGPIVQGCFR